MTNAQWDAQDLYLVNCLAKPIVGRTLSYYRAVKVLRRAIPDRTPEAIRGQLKKAVKRMRA